MDADPRLLLEAGNVKTPGGDEVRRVTLYEFLLGTGDYELAEKVELYFAIIKDGAQERRRQYQRYRPHIEGLLNQKPYDLSFLIDLIKKASPEEIRALLNKDMTVISELSEALIQFRKDWAPRILLKPSMHYNYASLKLALELLSAEWINLCKGSEENYDRITLVWRQLIGFEMRRFPGIDRCILAQRIHSVTEERVTVARSYNFKKGNTDFPITDSDTERDGLGWDFAVDVFALPDIAPEARMGSGKGRGGDGLEKLCLMKALNLQNLCSSSPVSQVCL